MGMSPAVELSNVSKSYDEKRVMDYLNLGIEEGKVTGLLGPNGSGKSTLLKMLVGQVKPDSGNIRIFGRAPSVAANARIAYLPDRAGWYGYQTVKEALVYASVIFPAFDMAKAKNLVLSMKLDEHSKVSVLSRGQQACLNLIFCLARNVDLVLLDEPFSGIDLISRERIIQGIIDSILDRRQTMIITTHEIYEAESLFEQAVFLDYGRIALQGESEDLRSKEGSLEAIYRRLFR